MKLVTWNINGLRSLQQSSTNNLKTTLDNFDADIICFQETKLSRDTITSDLAHVDGYFGFFSFCRVKSGYSGVVTYCKTLPEAAQEGLSSVHNRADDVSSVMGPYNTIGEAEQFDILRLKELDFEGRAVVTKHSLSVASNDDKNHPQTLCVVNVYCPRADPDSESRLHFKLEFYTLLQLRTKALLKAGNRIMIVGDLNCAHRKVDHCEGEITNDFELSPSRIWLDSFLSNGSIVDCFRRLHPKRRQAYTCWNTSVRARETNYGTRIDYIFADSDFARGCESCDILPYVMGSDHCPVFACWPSCTLLDPVSDAVLKSPICSKSWPEFTGRQTNLRDFLIEKRCSSSSNNDAIECVASISTNSTCDLLKRQKRLIPVVNKRTSQQSSQVSMKQFVITSATYSCSSSASTVNSSTTLPPDKNQAKLLSEERTRQPDSNAHAVEMWKTIFKCPSQKTAPPPKCKGHNEICLLRTVKKKGPNFNRQFYVCPRADGAPDNPEASCNYFQWLS